MAGGNTIDDHELAFSLVSEIVGAHRIAVTGFVKCSGGHLACNGTVELRNGQRFHQCFCGEEGFIDGVIKTIEANHRSIQPELAATSPTQAPEKEVGGGSDMTALPTSSETTNPKRLSASENSRRRNLCSQSVLLHSLFARRLVVDPDIPQSPGRPHDDAIDAEFPDRDETSLGGPSERDAMAAFVKRYNAENRFPSG